MTTDIGHVTLPFYGGVIAITADPKGNLPLSSKSQELAFEVDDPVPPYQLQSEEKLKVVNDTINSPQTGLQLQEEMRNMGKSVHDIEVWFNNVADGLRKAQEEGTTKQREQLKEFAARWATHRTEFIRLLWESRRISGCARATAEDFAGDFIGLLSDTEVTLEEKKVEIEMYRRRLLKDIGGSSGTSQGFSDLRAAVSAFRCDVTSFLRPLPELEDQMLGLQESIAEVVKAIAALTQKVSSGFWASLGWAGGLALCVLCPPLWIGAPMAACQTAENAMGLFQARRERDAKIGELECLRKKYESEAQSAKGMVKIYAIIGPLQYEMQLIATKLVVFERIWRLIHADLVKIEETLEIANGSGGHGLFRRRLETVSSIYRALAVALHQYETNVHI